MQFPAHMSVSRHVRLNPNGKRRVAKLHSHTMSLFPYALVPIAAMQARVAFNVLQCAATFDQIEHL